MLSVGQPRAILYECLTGRPPFKAATVMDTLLQVIADEPVPPRQLNPGTPRDLETVCLKCLAKEPARRYGSALELGEELARFNAGEPIQARPVGRLERVWSWCLRNRLVASLLAMVLTLLTVGGAVAGVLAVMAFEARNRALNREAETTEAKLALQNTNTALVESKAVMAGIVAQTLLQPLNSTRETVLSDAGIEALWQLAAADEQVRLSFLDAALRDPETVRRLERTSPFACHALVGLDRKKKARVEQLLRERLLAAAHEPLDFRQNLSHFSKEPAVLRDRKEVDPAADPNGTSPQPTTGVTDKKLETALFLLGSKEGLERFPPLTEQLSGWAATMTEAQLTRAAVEVTYRLSSRDVHSYAHSEALFRCLARLLARLDPAVAVESIEPGLRRYSSPRFGGVDDVQVLSAALVSLRVQRDQPMRNIQSLAQATREVKRAYVHDVLSGWLTTVAKRMEPLEAGDFLSKAITRTMYSAEQRVLASGLAAVAQKLEDKEAARVCELAASKLLEQLESTNHPESRHGRIEALAIVVSRMTGEAASAAVEQLTTLPLDFGSILLVARTLRSAPQRPGNLLTSRIGPLLATKLTNLSGSAINGPEVAWDFAQEIRFLSKHMQPSAAQAACAKAAGEIFKAMKNTTTTRSLCALTSAIAHVVHDLSMEQAAPVCRQATTLLSREMRLATSLENGEMLAEALRDLVAYLEPTEARAVRLQIATFLCQVLNKRGILHTSSRSAAMLASMIEETRPSALTGHQLVELLKQPLCVGAPRRVVLDELESRHKRKFDDHWEFVRFATEAGLALDFTSPPNRP